MKKGAKVSTKLTVQRQIQDSTPNLPLFSQNDSDCDTAKCVTPKFRQKFAREHPSDHSDNTHNSSDDNTRTDHSEVDNIKSEDSSAENTKSASSREDNGDNLEEEHAKVDEDNIKFSRSGKEDSKSDNSEQDTTKTEEENSEGLEPEGKKQVQSRQLLERLVPFRWIFSEEKREMSDKSEKDNSSVEMAVEADPNTIASRPSSAADIHKENGKIEVKEKNGPKIHPVSSTSSLKSTLSHQSASTQLTPKKASSKSNMTISSATAATLNLAAPTTIGSAGGAAMLRPVKKKVIELECAEIRWHYKKTGESKWTPFRGYDSMVLEVAYRASKGIPLDKKTIALGEQLPQTKNVIVLDNLYEWNPEDKTDHVTSVYWKDENLKIRRGSWFFADTMQPIGEELAETVELHHLEKFRNQMIPDSPVFNENEVNKKPVLTMLKWEEHDEVRWNSVIDVSFYNNTKANRLFRFVTRGKGVFPLKRGFSSEASIDEGMPNFSDLILVVHGIGQKGYENLIAKNTTQIREVIEHLMDKYHSHEKRRPMILPIEWRSSLVLDNGLTETITLPRMPQVRSTLNSIAMDIMYYQSPLYRTEIVNGVIKCLNATYTKFVKNNPNFDGAVSLFAHSLGSVIAYDIITNYSPLLLYDEFVTKAIEHRKNETEESEEKKLFTDFYESRRRILEKDGHMQEILLKRDEDLKFKVKNLFCVGSPLGVFIIMRGASAEELLPKKTQCERIYNIFHPYDPVAYRLEPMFHENYKNIRPIKLFTYNEVNRDYSKLGYDCHRSYLKKLKKQQKKEAAAASGEKTAESDEKRKEADDDDEDSDSGDCSSIHSPDCYSGPSPRSDSPVGPEDMQENMGNGTNPNVNTPLKVETTQSRWWRFGSTAEKKPKEEGVKDKEEKEKPEQPAEKKEEKVEKKEDKVVLTPAEQLAEGIPNDEKVPYRIDFQLQTSLTDKSYWSVLKSHFGYWTNYDVTAFLINQLYPPSVSEPSPKV